jgi:radical SAM superfamily enzyme YgiQ (UPF0313 family)
MNITFVSVGSEQLAISLLSGIAKRAGHRVSLAFSAALFHDRYNLEIPWLANFFDDTSYLLSQIEEQNPDVLVFSPLTATYQWSLQIAEKVKSKRPNVKTIFGGVHISAVPHKAILKSQIDFLVVGEGEVAFTEILDRIEGAEFNDKPIANTWFKAKSGEIIKGQQVGFNQDLDALPAFDKTIWESHLRIRDKYLTMASRGCPYRCTFCFNNFFAELPDDKKNKGKYVRFRSVDHVLDELKQAVNRYGKIRFIDFQDDVFTANKKWLREFLPRYRKEIGIPFQCLTHPKYMDEEVAKLMSEAGCKWIQMGVQSMDESYKKSLLRYERSDDIMEACRVMSKYGIKAKLDHMFGLPGEPISAQEEALKLYVKYPPSRIQTFWTSFLPGTEMFKEALSNGTLSKDEADRLDEGIDFYFYRNDSNLDHEKAQLYKAYNFIFKILPLLPISIRRRLTINTVAWIPNFIAQPIAVVADLLTGLRYGNPDFVAYLRHYVFHLWKYFFYKITKIPLKATRVENQTPIISNRIKQELINYKPYNKVSR